MIDSSSMVVPPPPHPLSTERERLLSMVHDGTGVGKSVNGSVTNLTARRVLSFV